MLLSCQTNSNIIYSWFLDFKKGMHISDIDRQTSKKRKTRCISDAKFPPRKRKRYLPDILILLESQIFGKLPKISILFFFNDLVRHHPRCWWYTHTTVKFLRDTRCSRSSFPLLPLGSIPAQSLPVREIYRDFHKSEKPQKFLPRSL